MLQYQGALFFRTKDGATTQLLRPYEIGLFKLTSEKRISQPTNTESYSLPGGDPMTGGFWLEKPVDLTEMKKEIAKKGFA